MLRNLDPAFDRRLAEPAPVVRLDATPQFVEPVVTVTALSSSRGHLTRPDAGWRPEDLRDYVVAEIERVHGRQPAMEPFKLLAIFRGFHSRWGADASAKIARMAFSEMVGGWWNGAPITVTRFTKNSDPYFAQKIAEMVAQA